MKRYSATQLRLLWNMVIITVLAIGVYVVLILPGIDLKAAGVGTHSSPQNSAPGGTAGKRDVLAPQEMRTFIVSLQESCTGADPFLRSGEQEWKTFLGELRTRPPRLQGIIAVQGTRIALINGSQYEAGDEVKGFTITDVADTKVFLVKDGRPYTIHLAQ